MAERQALHAVKPAKSANWEEHSVRSTNEEIDFRRTYQNTTIWVPTVTRRDQEEIRGVSEQKFNGNDQKLDLQVSDWNVSCKWLLFRQKDFIGVLHSLVSICRVVNYAVPYVRWEKA